MKLTTARLLLIPATSETVRAEMDDRPTFAALLEAAVPANWPPEILADALPWVLRQIEAQPNQEGWVAWYSVLQKSMDRPATLAGSAGFMGPPQEGTVEIGYSVLPQFQRQGYGAEMASALVDWALAHAEVMRVIADAHPDNAPSIRLLRRLGFTPIGIGAQPELARFERRNPPISPKSRYSMQKGENYG